MSELKLQTSTELNEYPALKQSIVYLNEKQTAKVLRALQFATKAHQGQMRASGEAYITHPAAVATILGQLKMDHQCIMAGLLHDVIEDTSYDYQDIESTFDSEIADMVEGVTKIDRMPAKSKKENQAENFLKMLILENLG